MIQSGWQLERSSSAPRKTRACILPIPYHRVCVTCCYFRHVWASWNPKFLPGSFRNGLAIVRISTGSMSTILARFDSETGFRSEKGRVGEEGRYRWGPAHLKKKRKKKKNKTNVKVNRDVVLGTDHNCTLI